jgi:hypothetical protein
VPTRWRWHHGFAVVADAGHPPEVGYRKSVTWIVGRIAKTRLDIFEIRKMLRVQGGESGLTDQGTDHVITRHDDVIPAASYLKLGEHLFIAGEVVFDDAYTKLLFEPFEDRGFEIILPVEKIQLLGQCWGLLCSLFTCG